MFPLQRHFKSLSVWSYRASTRFSKSEQNKTKAFGKLPSCTVTVKCFASILLNWSFYCVDFLIPPFQIQTKHCQTWCCVFLSGVYYRGSFCYHLSFMIILCSLTVCCHALDHCAELLLTNKSACAPVATSTFILCWSCTTGESVPPNLSWAAGPCSAYGPIRGHCRKSMYRASYWPMCQWNCWGAALGTPCVWDRVLLHRAWSLSPHATETNATCCDQALHWVGQSSVSD